MGQLPCRILLVEDDDERAEKLRSWLPEAITVVTTTSAGRALGLLKRDRGYIYAGIMLDHDLQIQTATEDDKGLSGTDLVSAIAGNINKKTLILIHSYNRARAPLMAERLSKAGFQIFQKFIDQLTEKEVREWAEDARDLWQEWQDA